MAIVSNRNLCNVGRKKGLEPFIMCTPGSKLTPYEVATCVEAIVGAVYKDSQNDLVAVKRSMVIFGLI